MIHLLKKNSVLTVLAFSLVFTSTPAVPAYAAKATRTANIYSFEGEVTIKRGGDKTLPAFEGMRLSSGDTILTGLKSKAVVSIDSDKTITVDANTEITLDDLSGTQKKSQTSTSVFYGSTVNTVKNKLEEGSSFDTKTSSAVMGVRGTSYLVRQDSSDVDVIVGSGVVAVSPIAASGHAVSEPIPVSQGEQLRHNAMAASVPTPIDGNTLLHLSPVVASELITEEILQAITDKPASIQNCSDLLQTLQKQEDDREEAIKKQETERNRKISQADTPEPVAFYVSGEVLSGQSNSLLRSENEQTILPNTDPPAPATLPTTDTLPATEPAIEPTTEAPFIAPPLPENGNTTKLTVPSSDNSGGDTGGVTSNPPDTPAEKPEETPGNGSGSGDDSGGDSVTKPTVGIENLQQDTVYTQTSPLQSLALTVSWDKSADATGYILETKNQDGTYIPVLPRPNMLENATIHRIVLPESERSQLHQAVLRITPIVSADKQPVPEEIRLNFDTASSGKIKKLAPPENLQVITSDEEYELTFSPVADCSQYRVSLYQGETIIQELSVSGSANPVVVALGNQLPDSFTARVTALGDQFDRWDSSDASITFTAPSLLPKLATPSGVMVTRTDGSTIYWNRVPADASVCGKIRYALSFSVEYVTENVGYLTNHALGDIAYDLTERDKQHLNNIQIRAYDSCGHYEASDWADIRPSNRQILVDWPQTMLPEPPVSHASPSDASPSDAWCIGRDDEWDSPEEIPLDTSLHELDRALLPAKEDFE